MDILNYTSLPFSNVINPFAGIEDKTTEAKSATNYLDDAKAQWLKLVPRNSKGEILAAGTIGGGVSGTSPNDTGGLEAFKQLFDPSRFICILFGVLLFAAGVFLLGKQQIVNVKNIIP